MDNPNQSRERRQNYRIIYPEKMNPKLVIKNVEYEVLDLSEDGIRFKIKEQVKLPGDLFHASVILHNEQNIEIIGRIIRITGTEAAMFMVIKKIPYQLILAEQAFLRQADSEE